MASHDHPPDKRQFPWTPEGQAARADFSDFLHRSEEKRILDQIEEMKVLLHQLRDRAEQNELLVATTELVREFIQTQRTLFRAQQEPPKPSTPRAKHEPEREPEAPTHTPQNRDWRIYVGFKSDFQAREQAIRSAAAELGVKPNLSIENFAEQRGADSVKSIKRCMKDTYGLDPERDWPPSTWPEHPPKNRVRSIRGHSLSLVAAGMFGWAVLDFVSDGRFDHTVRMIRFVGCHVGLPM